MAELPVPSESAVGGPGQVGHAEDEPMRWLSYGLGLALQTFLWFLLFLGIAVAVLVGSRLTEFRYVGF
jgi:hypothetical protein